MKIVNIMYMNLSEHYGIIVLYVQKKSIFTRKIVNS